LVATLLDPSHWTGVNISELVNDTYTAKTRWLYTSEDYAILTRVTHYNMTDKWTDRSETANTALE